MRKHTTSINERARAILDISRDEYALCQYIHYRSADPRSSAPGWCSDKKSEIAEFIGITTRGLFKMAIKLESLRLIDVSPANGYYRATERFIDCESGVKQGGGRYYSEQSSDGDRNKVPMLSEQSSDGDRNKVPMYIKEEIDKEKEERETSAPATFKVEIHEDAKVEVVAVPDIYQAFGQRPNAQTPVELANAMKELYSKFPEQFRVDILDGGKAQNYTREKRNEILMQWACNVIKNNKGSDTYRMLNADLQQWFLRQPSFERTQQPAAGQAPKTVDVKINRG